MGLSSTEIERGRRIRHNKRKERSVIRRGLEKDWEIIESVIDGDGFVNASGHEREITITRDPFLY